MAPKKGRRSKRKRSEEEPKTEREEAEDLAPIWKEMKRENISKDGLSALVSLALQVITLSGIPEIAASHVNSQILQKFVEVCTQTERDAVFEELMPHFPSLACNVYSVRLVQLMLDNASKAQLEGCISSFHGHVVSLLKQKVGSEVIEHAFQLANASQKQSLLVELYSTEHQLFKDRVSTKEGRLVDIIPELGLQKDSVQQQMASVINSIIDMGVVDHSIIHTALLEYFTIADKRSAKEMIEKLWPHLFRMIHTRAGSKLGILCVKHGSAWVRSGFIESIKSFVGKMAFDQCGSTVLACILSMDDNTELINENIIPGLKTMLKDLALDERGRLPLLQLLHSNYQLYLGPEDLASLCLSIPSLSKKVNKHLVGGKKDPSVRRRRKTILVKSGLAESLIDICVDNAGELLRSNFGKEVIYEVATGGAGQFLQPTLSNKLETLYKAISALAALPEEEKPEEEPLAVPEEENPEEEHVLKNSHSSWTIRKLILECPSFASTIWKIAFKGKCEMWSQGHSSKVVWAFLESPSTGVQNLAKPELQHLIDSGTLKMYSPLLQ